MKVEFRCVLEIYGKDLKNLEDDGLLSDVCFRVGEAVVDKLRGMHLRIGTDGHDTTIHYEGVDDAVESHRSKRKR